MKKVKPHRRPQKPYHAKKRPEALLPGVAQSSRANLMRCLRVFLHSRLFADSQPIDHLFVTVGVVPPQIFKQPLPLADHRQQAAS